MPFIYKITNQANDKSYIGKTTLSLKRRLIQHFADAKYYKGSTKFYNTLKKYPRDMFIIEQLEQCNDNLLDNREIYWIKKLQPYYNILPGGKGGIGRIGPCSIHIRKKISKTLLARKFKEAKQHKNWRIDKSSSLWNIKTPQGTIIQIKNLKQWCKDNNFNYDSVKYSIYWSKQKHYKEYSFIKVGR